MVRGTWVSASPAKATIPMRSYSRPRTNLATSSLATARRFWGWKSSASMEVEMSTTSAMAIPSASTLVVETPVRGPARARMRATAAAVRSQAGARAAQRAQPDAMPSRVPARENRRVRPWPRR